jgi:Protein of unknown function (DUF2970)
MDEPTHPAGRRASLIDTVRAVASSFFGVRGRRAHESDVAKLNPVHVIIIGVMMAAIFVLTLIVIVKTVLK